MVKRFFRVVSRGIGDLFPKEFRRKLVDLRNTRDRARLEARFEELRANGKTIAHFLHIGKTGGTAVKAALVGSTNAPEYFIALRGHGIRLQDVPEGDKVFFFLRDPIARFESGFYSRKTKGQPRYDAPWGPFEYRAFSRFESANDLAEALSNTDGAIRRRAEHAMKSIRHVNSSFWDWFGNRELLESRRDSVIFFGFQESLDEDFERLKNVLDLPAELELPKRSDAAAYSANKTGRPPLSEKAIENIRNWYQADYEFIELCKNDFPIGNGD